MGTHELGKAGTKTFQVLLGGEKDGAVDWKSARVIESTNHRSAALLAFTLSPNQCEARRAWRAGRPVYAFAWDDSDAKHENGAPIIVHAFEFARGVPQPEASDAV